MNGQEQTNGGTIGQGVTLGNIFSWAGLMVKQPRHFFANLAKRGGFGAPVLYALAWLFLSTLVELVVGRVRPQQVQFGAAVEIGWILIGPFILLAIGFVVSAVLFVIWHLMGSKENYETAFRCWAFTTPVAVLGALLGFLPFLNVLAFLYGMFLLVMASVETHRVSPTKAWAVWGTFAAVLLILVAMSAIARQALQRQGVDLNQMPTLPALGQTPAAPAPAEGQ